MKRTEIVLYGGGGVAIETVRYIRDVNHHLAAVEKSVVVTDVVDIDGGRPEDISRLMGSPVARHKDISTIQNIGQKKFLITLGHSPIRQEVYNSLKQDGHSFYTLIHPTVEISDTSEVGAGSILSPFVLVGAFSRTGENVLVNIRSTIGHDTVVGESSIISPHVAIGGASVCGKSVFYGAGVIVNPGLTIGDYVKLSAGAIVIKDVEPGYLAHGNPATGRRLFNPETGRSLFEG